MFLVGKLQLIKRKTTDNEPQHQQDKQSILQVGRGSPCPVLQQPKKQPPPIPSPLERGVNTLASCWRTGRGDHRPTMICAIL